MSGVGEDVGGLCVVRVDAGREERAGLLYCLGAVPRGGVAEESPASRRQLPLVETMTWSSTT
ncbi:hypothetical protein ACIGW8_36955 [Streptomyces sioyaensis]|uniref:hypothetical protein n=1 Tax=Streptomyces sioyaensis TaxID=67364 RepID=UPI0037D80B0E